jgi:glutathione S-transferase
MPRPRIPKPPRPWTPPSRFLLPPKLTRPIERVRCPCRGMFARYEHFALSQFHPVEVLRQWFRGRGRIDSERELADANVVGIVRARLRKALQQIGEEHGP